jgi:hypothetical protein
VAPLPVCAAGAAGAALVFESVSVVVLSWCSPSVASLKGSHVCYFGYRYLIRRARRASPLPAYPQESVFGHISYICLLARSRCVAGLYSTRLSALFTVSVISVCTG